MVEHLFGSKTRVKLLNLFLSNPERAFYVREITRKIDEQINSVRRELANLLELGIIKNDSDSADNKLYYKVNKDYEYYVPLKQMFSDEQPSTSASQTKSDASQPQPHSHPWKKHVEQVGNVRVALLSGGLIGNPSTQVDVLLVGSPTTYQVRKLIKKFETEEGRPLNYATMDYDNFYYRLSIKDKFISDIIGRDPTVLVDTDNLLQTN